MAKIQCELKWDGEKVLQTYTVLAVEPNDLIYFVTSSPQFVIECPDERLARKLGLNRANVPNRQDLYQINKASSDGLSPETTNISNGSTKVSLASTKTLNCGYVDDKQEFKAWSSGVTSPI
jgi:hypothetical protein